MISRVFFNKWQNHTVSVKRYWVSVICRSFSRLYSYKTRVDIRHWWKHPTVFCTLALQEKCKLTLHLQIRTTQAYFPILVRSKKLRRYSNDNHGMRAVSIFLNSLCSSTPLVLTPALKIFFSLSELLGDGVLPAIVMDAIGWDGGIKWRRWIK